MVGQIIDRFSIIITQQDFEPLQDRRQRRRVHRCHRQGRFSQRSRLQRGDEFGQRSPGLDQQRIDSRPSGSLPQRLFQSGGQPLNRYCADGARHAFQGMRQPFSHRQIARDQRGLNLRRRIGLSGSVSSQQAAVV